ncbi:MAG TPA: adenosylcobinamide-GDP ribazoletransferase [Burkholderiales bacterium]|nr:adenosylcobinamide-GDP ribazoletransferase [Burkholderiales bacterium]
MKTIAPLLVAVQFLTRFPVPSARSATPEIVGRSLLYYPLVGLMLGAVLAGLNAMLQGTPSLLHAAIVLAAWVALTGALHLDGLADSADAWIGGIGDRKRTLAIMKDPHCGPAAVVTLIVVLLLKATALYALQTESALALAVVPMLARTSILLLFITTSYVRPGGLGTALSARLRRVPTATVLITVAVSTIYFLGMMGAGMVIIVVITCMSLRTMMQRRIGGTTGDTAGALVEITEVALLTALALRLGH